MSAQLWCPPAATAVAAPGSGTCCGCGSLSNCPPTSPLPSSPELLSPQHQTRPCRSTPHTCVPAAPPRPATLTSTRSSDATCETPCTSPVSPLLSTPQHLRLPPPRRTQVACEPALICTAPLPSYG